MGHESIPMLNRIRTFIEMSAKVGDKNSILSLTPSGSSTMTNLKSLGSGNLGLRPAEINTPFLKLNVINLVKLRTCFLQFFKISHKNGNTSSSFYVIITYLRCISHVNVDKLSTRCDWKVLRLGLSNIVSF